MITKEDVPRIITKLIDYTESLDSIRRELKKIPIDFMFKVEEIPITRQAVISMLKKYLNEDISLHTIEDWAHLVLGCPFKSYELGYSQIISDVLDRLTEASNYLTITTAHECIQDLNNASFDITDVD